jgi:transcriptional regulator with XRE-family HTH domain
MQAPAHIVVPVATLVGRVSDLGGYLREQREHARLSVRQLATLAGVSNPYLSQIERGLRKPSAEVLQQIAQALRISAETLYQQAGILDHHDRPDVEAALIVDPHLTERQRRVLLDLYDEFRYGDGRAPERSAPSATSAPAATSSKSPTSPFASTTAFPDQEVVTP